MEQLNEIYSKTYNFVYLRAKNILEKEDDIQQLMREVYIKAADQDIRDDRLFKWLGKQTYLLGSSKYRKRKMREADHIEVDEREYRSPKSADLEQTKEVICDKLEELPDMYQATLYAFYYDHMKIKAIAEVMGCSAGTILSRLDYAHKYLSRALEIYSEENRVKVQFSIEAVCRALNKWSKRNCLSETVAQNVYGSICRELNIRSEEISPEESAGADCRMEDVGTDVIGAIVEELENYDAKSKTAVKPALVLAVVVGVLAIFALVAILIAGKSKKEENPKEKEPPISQEENKPSDDVDDPDSKAEEPGENADSSEYILPSDTVRLTRADLQGLSQEQLRLARNEIFARYGMIFGPQDLQDYFSSKSWYSPRITYEELSETVEMNEIEKANLSLIMEVEDEM